jgi:hypothetical protein
MSAAHHRPEPWPFELTRNPFGKLVLKNAQGEVYEGVVPVRAFPIQAPELSIALVLGNGREVGWIDSLASAPHDIADLVREELEGREFMPEISRIAGVSSFATPCTWTVETDRGQTDFTLKGEEDIRRVGEASLLIADNHGVHYLIRDMWKMDRGSRRILDRFL